MSNLDIEKSSRARGGKIESLPNSEIVQVFNSMHILLSIEGKKYGFSLS